MCGIVSYISFGHQEADKEGLLKKMSADIHHRGPDDDGFFFSDWVNLGFKRLSILDTSDRGHQPMTDDSGNYVLVMNGEVYNFKELKAELPLGTQDYRSGTDTEVVLEAYKHWGTEAFSKFQGMFAIMIYDRSKEELIVARDQLGIKPFYYYRGDAFWLFGSEIKSFRHKVRFAVNEKKLYEQFVYAYVSGGNTIFDQIHRVLPGSYLRFDRNGLREEKTYYDVTAGIGSGTHTGLDDKAIESALNESISAHTVSDVGYNIQLSGGVDSSYVTAVLSQQQEAPLHTFSVELDDEASDESAYQKLVSDKFGTLHHAYRLGAQSLFESYEKATWHHDIPIVHPSSVYLMMLCKHSRENSKVILTGEGADELFGGYSRYEANPKMEKQNWLANNPRLLTLIPGISKFKQSKEFIQQREFGIDDSVYFNIQRFLPLIQPLERDLDYRRKATGPFSALRDKVSAHDQTSYLQWLFERQDKMSMAESVESRVPFSNHKLFDMMNKVDPTSKIVDGPKSILKRIGKKYFDDDFLYRRKNGFVLPFDHWLREDKGLKPWLELISDKTFAERGYYSSKLVKKLVDEQLYQNKNHAKLLLNLINFEIWHRIFIDKPASFSN